MTEMPDDWVAALATVRGIFDVGEMAEPSASTGSSGARCVLGYQDSAEISHLAPLVSANMA